jgi:hypothetical protein
VFYSSGILREKDEERKERKKLEETVGMCTVKTQKSPRRRENNRLESNAIVACAASLTRYEQDP